jgi:hypothetical protein
MLVLVVFWVRRNNVGCRELASGSGGAAASGGCRRQVTHQGAVVAQETGAQNNQWQLVQPMVRTLIDSEKDAVEHGEVDSTRHMRGRG